MAMGSLLLPPGKLSPPLASDTLLLPPKKTSPPPPSAVGGGFGGYGVGRLGLLGYPSTFGGSSLLPVPPLQTPNGVSDGASFTHTFLRGILTSIDSKVNTNSRRSSAGRNIY